MQTTHDVTFTATEVRKRYVSWDRGEAEREWSCLTVLAGHAPGVAPKPLRREQEAGAPVLVMQRLPGDPLGDVPLTSPQTQALGRTLRQVYDIPRKSIEAAGIRERVCGPTDMADQVREWLTASYDADELRDPPLVTAALESAHHWLTATDQLPQPHLTTLGIADLNPANILWDGRTCRLVDFEDGGLTDPAFELADHTEHIAARLSNIFDTEALTAAVGLTTAERQRMTAYRPLWATYWLLMLLPGNGGFRRNPPGTTEAQATHVLTLLT
jgi:aminoglycoside phosphotransferase (APT) family kinase protein